MTTDATSPRPTPRLDPAALHEITESGAGPRLLDVRTPGEFRTAHIPGSYNVPLDTLREHRAELLRHLDEDVVLICRSGGRAAQAEQAWPRPGCPTCASSKAASSPGRRPVVRSTTARPAGTSNARYGWSLEASSCCPAWRPSSCPACTSSAPRSARG